MRQRAQLLIISESHDEVTLTLRFSYPSCCILPHEPVVLGRYNEQSFNKLFMSAVSAQLTSFSDRTAVQLMTPQLQQVFENYYLKTVHAT
jgi:hypothetical protein